MFNLKKILKKTYFIRTKKLKKSSFLDFSDKKKNYSNSFFEEYKRYPKIQLDSFNKLNLNEERFYNNSMWSKNNLKNKNILEIGSGAGKFTEILLKTDCNLITTDINDSVRINYKNNYKRKYQNKVYFIKNNVQEKIFKEKVFDFIVLFGVLQNVNNQKKILKDSISLLKKHGKLTLDITKANKFYIHLLNPKYFWRIIFKRMSPTTVYKIVNFLIPKVITIDTYLKKNLGSLGRIFSKIFFPFPLINYYFLPLTNKIKTKMSVLDTFDALASQFDIPLTKTNLVEIFKEIENELNIKLKNVDITEKKSLIIANIIR